MKRTVIRSIVLVLYLSNVLFLGFNFIKADSNVIYQDNNTLNSSGYEGTILYVGGLGPNNYSSIQEAINDSQEGGTVFVYNDSSPYDEERLIIDKPLHLIGENKYTTVINLYRDINGEGSVYIPRNNDGVLIQGFTIQNGYSGILCSSNYTTITDNILQNNWRGVFLFHCHDNCIYNNIVRDNYAEDEVYNYFNRVAGISVKSYSYSTYNHLIYNNTITDNYAGIYIGESYEDHHQGETYNITIVGNNITHNQGSGVWFDEVEQNYVQKNSIAYHSKGIEVLQSSPNNVFSDNTLVDNSVGIQIGGAGTEDNRIDNNTFLRNDIGVRFFSAQQNHLRNNRFDANGIGISFIDSDENIVVGNSIRNSSLYGIDIPDHFYDLPSQSFDNRLYHNNFYSNGIHACDYWENSWDNGYPSGGNYWDGYIGIDRKSGLKQNHFGSDGIGDTPYAIPEGDNKDEYPLMDPLILSKELTIRIKQGCTLGVVVQIIILEPIDLDSLNWSIIFESGLLLYPWNHMKEGSFPPPDIDGLKTISTPVFGFGIVDMRVTVNTISKNAKGFVFGPFLLGVKEVKLP